MRTLTADSTYTAQQLLGAPKSYWLDLRNYDPVAAAAGITVPMLFLQGERDYQVNMDDFALWQSLSGMANTTYQTFPTLSHMLVPGGEPPSPDDYKTPYIPVDAAVMQAVAAFIQN